jgi:hypothetical protein
MRRIHDLQLAARSSGREVGEQRGRRAPPAHSTSPGIHPDDSFSAQPVVYADDSLVKTSVSHEDCPQRVKKARLDNLHVGVHLYDDIVIEATAVKRAIEVMVCVGERMMTDCHGTKLDILLFFEAG